MTEFFLSRYEQEILVRAAASAPSLHNTQPWHFTVHGDVVDVRADLTRRLEGVDPLDRQLHIGCGAALYNLEVAARRLGLELTETLLPHSSDPQLLARLVLRPGYPPGLDDAELYAAIPRRRTNRRPFEERQIPAEVLGMLDDAARGQGARLDVVKDEAERARVTEIVRVAELSDATDPALREERARWVGTPAGGAREQDGVPDESIGPIPDELSAVVRDLAPARRIPGRSTARFERHPQLALLLTDRDDRRDWLTAGKALQAVLLVATVHGVSASFVNQPLERPDLRALLRNPSRPLGSPQMLMRLGYGQAVPATPRRPLREVADLEDAMEKH